MARIGSREDVPAGGSTPVGGSVSHKRYSSWVLRAGMVSVTVQFAVVGVALLASLAVAAASGATPLTRRTVPAAAPWSVAAGVVVVASRAGVYEVVSPTPPAAVLVGAAAVLAVAGWVGTAELAALRGIAGRDRYLATAGAGAVTVVAVSLLQHVGGALSIRMVWLPVTVVVATMCAALGYFALGLVFTDAVVEFRLAGLVAVWTVVLEGACSAAAVESLGHAEAGAVTILLSTALDAAGVAHTTWLLLPLHTLVGVALVGATGWIARRRRLLGTAALLLATVGSLLTATVVLLTAALLG